MTVATLLPPNASPFERSLEQAMAFRGDEREVFIDKLWRPFECPIEVLPFLAWGLGVRRWDPAWPEAVRRQAVADAIAVHRIRGTLGAVEAALDEIGAVYDIEERPGGAAFKMAISVFNSNTLLGETDPAKIREYVDDVKRFSVHYDLALAASLGCSPIRIAAGVAGVQIGDFRLEVDVAANSVATGAPTVSGHARVGYELTASPGTIADDDGIANVAWRYQWLRDGVEIAGATGATYPLVAADVGTRISCAVHFTDDAGYAERRASAETAAVLGQLALPEWTGAGLTTHTKILIRAAVDGEHIYRHADAGAAIGALLDGDDALGASRITRIRRREDAVRLHDNPDTDSMATVLDALTTPRVYFQTETALVSVPYQRGGGNFSNFSPVDAAAALIIDAIADNDRVIVAVASPA